MIQSVDIQQIADKFPDKSGGLRELYEKGPRAAFFLVKFWVSVCCRVLSFQDFFKIVVLKYTCKATIVYRTV
jgi:YAP binding domain